MRFANLGVFFELPIISFYMWACPSYGNPHIEFMISGFFGNDNGEPDGAMEQKTYSVSLLEEVRSASGLCLPEDRARNSIWNTGAGGP